MCREPCVSGSCIAPDTCNCTEGWSGRLCDQRKCHKILRFLLLPIYHLCSLCTAICKIPCENGGTCIAPDLCKCPSGWSGPHCETGRYICRYLIFKIQLCAITINFSDSLIFVAIWIAVCRIPCQNGGSCTNPDTCECLPGWTGGQCQIGKALRHIHYMQHIHACKHLHHYTYTCTHVYIYT